MDFLFSERPVEAFIFVSSILIAISVLASKASGRYGIPSLVLFLAVGMVAGSEGPGGIEFSNYELTYNIGGILLAIILFDGGMGTNLRETRPALIPGISLATLGVVATAVITGVFAHYVLGIDWLGSMLLGAIISSTDAAAVFSILRSKNLALKGALKPLLKFEAGSNDPTAIFLTTAVLDLAMRPEVSWTSFLIYFLLQAGLALGFGFYGAVGFRWVINRIGLEYEGLYNVFTLAFVLTIFSGTALLGGSGFLAAYVAGFVLGNLEFIHKGSIMRFHDGIAWLAQIFLFLLLGLLSFPSQLGTVWVDGILLSAFLMLIARPVSVFLGVPTKALDFRQKLFTSWVGLRGAAPILLATLPWVNKVAGAEYIFNLVFFVVLVSVFLQGTSIPWVAAKLGLIEPLRDEAFADGSHAVLPTGFSLVQIDVDSDSPAVGEQLVNVGLPSGVLLTSIEREGRYLVPRGDTIFEPGDRIRGFARPSNIDELNRTFGFDHPVVKIMRS